MITKVFRRDAELCRLCYKQTNNKSVVTKQKLEAVQLWQRLREPKKTQAIIYAFILYDKSITTIQETCLYLL